MFDLFKMVIIVSACMLQTQGASAAIGICYCPKEEPVGEACDGNCAGNPGGIVFYEDPVPVGGDYSPEEVAPDTIIQNEQQNSVQQ